jgi:hypothetical protein
MMAAFKLVSASDGKVHTFPADEEVPLDGVVCGSLARSRSEEGYWQSAIDPRTAPATTVDPSSSAPVYPPTPAPTATVYPPPTATTPAVDPTGGVGLGRGCKPGAPQDRRRNSRTGPLPDAPKKKAPILQLSSFLGACHFTRCFVIHKKDRVDGRLLRVFRSIR